MMTEEAAEAAIALLEQRGWHQGGAHGPGGSICMMGALALSVTDSAAFMAISDRLRAQAQARGFGHAAQWNDDPGTGYEDVVLALKQAGHSA